MASKSNVVALYTGGIHSLIEVAVRDDGVVFRRYQNRDPRYGYRWTAWSATSERWGDNLRANPEPTRSAGFATLFLRTGEANRRLPGAA